MNSNDSKSAVRVRKISDPQEDATAVSIGSEFIRTRGKASSDLILIQQLMASCVFNPLTSDFDMSRTLPNGDSVEEIANRIIKSNDRLTSFERLQIYNRQYWYRLTDCLYDDYPGMRAIIGDKKFYHFSCAYLVKYPSKNFSLSELGQNLIKFVEENPSWGGKRHQALFEMAKFEWAQVVAFDREFLPPLNLMSLEGKNPDQLKLKLQPYLSLLELNYPFDEFLIALKKKESNHSESVAEREDRLIVSEGKLALPRRRKTWLAVHRLNNLLYYKRLEEPAFLLLSELHKGKNLSEACNELISNQTKVKQLDLSQSIQTWFKEWGMLCWFVDPNYTNLSS